MSMKEEQSEFLEFLVAVNRVAKVVKGGRRFAFSALVVVGDGKGSFGFATGKAKEVSEARAKATNLAKRRMKRISLRQGRTIHHNVKGRYGAGKVVLRSAPSGKGIIAGGPMRAIFQALGIRDIVAKSIGTSNPHNMLKATVNALESLRAPKDIASSRGLQIGDLVKRREA